jgi:hypothetical protein
MNKKMFYITFICILIIVSVPSLLEDSVSYRTSLSGSYNCKLSYDKKVSVGDTCYLIIILEGFEGIRSDTSFLIGIRPEKGIKLVNDSDSLIQIFNPDIAADYFYEPDKIRIKVIILNRKYHSVKTSLFYNGKELAYCSAQGKSKPKKRTYRVK